MIEISINAELKEITEQELVALLTEVCEAALQHEQKSGSIGISVIDDTQIRELNAQFRGIDRPTDVLSFPCIDGSSYDVTDAYLGDIAISIDRAEMQANEYGHSLRRELAFLTVHGVLHLLGYDHEASDQIEAECDMFRKQEEILTSLGYKR